MSHTGVWRLYDRSVIQSLVTTLPAQTTYVPPKPYDLRPLPSVGFVKLVSQFPVHLRTGQLHLATRRPIHTYPFANYSYSSLRAL